MRSADRIAGLLRAACRDSLVVGVLSGSAVVRACTLIGRSLSGRTSFIGQRLSRRQPTRQFDETIHVITSSGLYRFLSTVASALGPDAWTRSRVGGAIGECWRPLAPAVKIRLLGWVVVVAGMSRAAMSPKSLLDSPIALTSWVAVLAFGGALFFLSPIIAAAWKDRTAMAEHEVVD